MMAWRRRGLERLYSMSDGLANDILEVFVCRVVNGFREKVAILDKISIPKTNV